MSLSRRVILRAVTGASAALALVAASLVGTGAAASAHPSHHGSGSSRIAFAFFENGVRSGEQDGRTSVGLVLTAGKSATTDRSVRVRTGGGSAEVGTAYEAFDERVTIPAGKASVGFRIPVAYVAEDASPVDFYVALSSPSAGSRLGALRVARVTIHPSYGPPPLGGTVQRFQDFESGVPDAIETVASRPAIRPRTSTAHAAVPGTVPQNRVLTVRLDRRVRSWQSAGFREIHESWDLEPSAAAPSISFRGQGKGGEIALLLRNGDRVFEYAVTDDSTGWRSLEPYFDEFRLQGDPSSSERYDTSDFTGYEVALRGVPAGRYQFDNPSLIYIF